MLSIIVPVFNSENYLAECLDSMAGQDLDYEIICINDGSTDSSQEILGKFAEKYNNIRIINQANRGQSVARNRGIELSKGDFILFVDSDDKVFPNTLKGLYETCRQYQLDILDFNAQVITNGLARRYWNDVLITNLPITGKKYITEFISKYKKQPFYSPWTHMYKKSFLLSNNIYFLEDRIYEDLFFTIQAYCYAERVLYMDKDIYLYRSNAGSTTKIKIKPKHIVDLQFISEKLSVFSKEMGINVPMDNIFTALRNFIIQSSQSGQWKEYSIYFDRKLFKNVHFNLFRIRNKIFYQLARRNFVFFILYARVISLMKKLLQKLKRN